MRNGIESIRNPNVFRNKFMSRIRLVIKDAQTHQELERYKRGELDLDRFLASERKPQLNGHIVINSKQSFGVRIDEILIATPSDIEKRKNFEFERYRELRAKGRITPQMRRYGERKEEKIEQDSDRQQLAKL